MAAEQQRDNGGTELGRFLRARRSQVTPADAAKTFRHPQVGRIMLGFQGLQLEGTTGQRLGVYLANPGTPDYDAMIPLDLTAPRPADRTAAERG